MNIGFLSNQLDNRGTGNALYNYAQYNEEILGNKSFIFTYKNGNHDMEAVKLFTDRFQNIYYPATISASWVDAIYHIKSGYNDGTSFNDIPYLVHSVFDNEPHGTVYATVSPWMGKRFSLPFVPHIVELPDTKENLRVELNIPDDAVVFGRHGGTDSFDIPFVKSTVYHYVKEYPNVYFVFMNTDIFAEHPRIIHLPPTVNSIQKRKFINTCDAMIHARARGETFGIAVGEFAICGKPVITYGLSPEVSHLQELGNFALEYHTEQSLKIQFDKVLQGPLITWGYGQYTPANVMEKFKEVFLNG